MKESAIISHRLISSDKPQDNFRGEDMATLRGGCENNVRMLAVFEVLGDLHEKAVLSCSA